MPGEAVTDNYLRMLQKRGGSSYFAGTDGHDTRKAVEVLGKIFGRNKLLLEGGDQINGTFLKAGVINDDQSHDLSGH